LLRLSVWTCFCPVFSHYTSSGFGIDEQIRLANACRDLDRRGVKWLMSNSSVALIHDLYSEYIIDVVPAKRAINCKGNRRGPVDEVLIRNY
jgi:DNA adenine methylase